MADVKELTLRKKQSLFVELLAKLIQFIYSHEGWELTLGEGFRPDKKGHMEGSLHYIRLAQDLNLFIFGKWIQNGKDPAWLEIGEYWESLHYLCRWGGRFGSKDTEILRFTGKDSNHFSIAHGGKA